MGALGPIAGLVYEALWCMADDGGAVLCTPELVKGEMFIFWPAVGLPEISAALQQLSDAERIYRYFIGDNEYALIIRWEKHQTVHNASKFRHPRPAKAVRRSNAATLPEEGGTPTIGEGQSSHPIHLPSSTPEHLITSTPDGGEQRQTGDGPSQDEFEEIWTAYPKRAGGDSKHDALLAFQARVRSGEEPAVMLAGVRRYATYCAATEKIGTEYVKQARTFLGRSRHYLETWDLPPAKSRARKGAPREYDYSNTTDNADDLKWQ